MPISLGPDPHREAVRDALEAIDAGDRPKETAHLDFKEEAGRRAPDGRVTVGSTQNDAAAVALAGECACMANTPGGGAIILGVADDGTPIGTRLNTEWLRHRIYELLQRKLTVDVVEASVRSVRVLALFVPRAVEPIRHRGRIHWRLDDHCVEVDASTWHERIREYMLYDWSAQASSLTIDHVRESAVDVARDFLRGAYEDGASELADATTPRLLSRLNAVDGNGLLTNAAALVFVGRSEPSVDYLRRDVSGGDSVARVRQERRSLLEQLSEVFRTASAFNPAVHIGRGIVRGQVRKIPERTLREAIVNGIAHRDWMAPDPTVVEHVGGRLRVTSPGGFFGGVNARNIITHPSKSRNTALTELLAALKVAEREGIGVDRMVADMLRLGLRPPDIYEISGPSVVTALTGDNPDQAWMAWLGRFDDRRAVDDLQILMTVDHIVRYGWVDTATLVPTLQVGRVEADDVLATCSELTVDGAALLTRAHGTPAGSDPAWGLGSEAAEVLTECYENVGVRRLALPGRTDIAEGYARCRGRISTTELASLVGAAPSNVGTVLKALEAEGTLAPSRKNRKGPGFFYRYVNDPY